MGTSKIRFSGKESLRNFVRSDGFREGGKSLLASVICILLGILVGLIAMIIIAAINPDISIANAFRGILYLFQGPFSSSNPTNIVTNFGMVIFYSAPLIMTGLSVAFAYKTGLFNIGAPGQYLAGVIGSLLVVLSIPNNGNPASGFFIWLLGIVAGILCGALWGAIPGALKAFFNVNEVISSIMTNWVAANLATLIFTNTTWIHSVEGTKSGFLAKPDILSSTPKFGLDILFPGSYADAGIFFAIIIAIVILIVMNKTTFGYELKACGFNKNASKYAGLNEKRNIVLSMVIAGGLAGLAGCFYFLNNNMEFKFVSAYQNLPAYGFNGIASAFLANCNPVGIIFSSVLIRWLNMGGDYLTQSNFNRYMADIIISIIIYLAGFTRIFKELMPVVVDRTKKFYHKCRYKYLVYQKNKIPLEIKKKSKETVVLIKKIESCVDKKLKKKLYSELYDKNAQIQSLESKLEKVEKKLIKYEEQKAKTLGTANGTKVALETANAKKIDAPIDTNTANKEKENAVEENKQKVEDLTNKEPKSTSDSKKLKSLIKANKKSSSSSKPALGKKPTKKDVSSKKGGKK